MAPPMYNPKVQVFVKCCVRGMHFVDDGFVDTEVKGPFYLDLMTCRTRLSSPFDETPMRALAYETSDELALRLVKTAETWHTREIKYDMDVTKSDIIGMVFLSFEAAVELKPKSSVKIRSDEMSLALAAMPRGSPTASARAAAAAESREAMIPVVDEDGAVHAPDGPSVDAAEDEVVGDDLEAQLGLQIDELEAVVAAGKLDMFFFGDEDEPEGDGANDEEALGLPTEEGAPRTEAIELDDNATLADLVAMITPDTPACGPDDVVVSNMAAAAAAMDPGSPSSSSTPSSSSRHVVGSQAWIDDHIHIDVLGYVTISLPGYDPTRVLGLVGYRGDMSSIFCNCHIHSNCSVSFGIKVHDVPKIVMARWLLQGKLLPRDAPIDEKRAEGNIHRAAWPRPI